ncbi:hypothetical protein [Pararhodobacter sp. CCB-MM2]|uniref:hypothetical protein n=1 Tax=Pararhodobacter sp. CCB-MM2 TaxID=1786003 RepID=UPI00131492FE|nr:hypothetical protein [Pararhodobacter sp. CCB-MM2]
MIALMGLRALLPWVPALAVALCVSHGAVGIWVWHWRGSVEADRVAVAQAAMRQAQARVAGLAEAQAAVAAERNRFRQELDDVARNDPDGSRECLSAESVRRLRAR